MAKQRKSAHMQEQIRNMVKQGMPVRKIAQALGISRQTVRKFRDGSPRPVNSAETGCGWATAVDWEKVAQQNAEGVTVKQLHAEFAPGVKYWLFWRRLRDAKPPVKPITLRLLV
jgi:uncharacterized protein YjcR